ncbi:MAG: hypothetical protein IKV67_11510 [Paludibacteraceae bacterium]|nr:hypothetical protein [Paludibacteraceae bacterium]
METKKLFGKLKKESDTSTLMQLNRLFFNEKVQEVLDKKVAEDKDFNEDLFRQFPEAKILDYRKEKIKIIRLPNVDFCMNACYIDKVYICLFFPLDYCSYQNNFLWFSNCIIGRMKLINDAMPEWRSEFRQFCETNASKIEKFEKSRLMKMHGYNILDHYVYFKTMDLLLMKEPFFSFYTSDNVIQWLTDHGGLPDSQDKKSYILKLKNSTIKYDFSRSKEISVLKNESRFDIDCVYLPYFSQIDENMPKWLEEGQSMRYECLKKKKMENISEKATKMLVKDKMKEMGYEYRFSEYQFTLEIKLQKKRKLKLTLPKSNLERVKSLLDQLPTYIDYINSVPMHFRIYFQDFQDNIGSWKKNE